MQPGQEEPQEEDNKETIEKVLDDREGRLTGMYCRNDNERGFPSHD